jgi:hypothetical protein
VRINIVIVEDIQGHDNITKRVGHLIPLKSSQACCAVSPGLNRPKSTTEVTPLAKASLLAAISAAPPLQVMVQEQNELQDSLLCPQTPLLELQRIQGNHHPRARAAESRYGLAKRTPIYMFMLKSMESSKKTVWTSQNYIALKDTSLGLIKNLQVRAKTIPLSSLCIFFLSDV